MDTFDLYLSMPIIIAPHFAQCYERQLISVWGIHRYYNDKPYRKADEEVNKNSVLRAGFE